MSTVDETAPGPHKIEVYEDEAGDFRWRLRAGNEEIIATSHEGYTDKRYTEARARWLFEDRFDDLEVVDLTEADAAS